MLEIPYLISTNVSDISIVSTTTRSLSLTCPDVTSMAGRSPLDTAVRWGRTEVVDYLQSLRKPSAPEPGM